MDNDLFEKMRKQRKAALDEARRVRGEHFSPYRIGPIDRLEWDDDEHDVTRVTLKVAARDSDWNALPRFFRAHALYMERLPPDDRTRYLCDIWLNYNACVKRSAINKGMPG